MYVKLRFHMYIYMHIGQLTIAMATCLANDSMSAGVITPLSMPPFSSISEYTTSLGRPILFRKSPSKRHFLKH